ncbi:hypothetical protein VP01_2705g1 [Puccinia sorghi]|uniref:Uncharacterized protein n=1 Tax=Puccinia sorghi TaxID=27349 RepID=A0A0L6V3K3_9BASI|nr:hypothetical protein VP01_2705g1 [Puccinia sorghi]
MNQKEREAGIPSVSASVKIFTCTGRNRIPLGLLPVFGYWETLELNLKITINTIHTLHLIESRKKGKIMDLDDKLSQTVFHPGFGGLGLSSHFFLPLLTITILLTLLQSYSTYLNNQCSHFMINSNYCNNIVTSSNNPPMSNRGTEIFVYTYLRNVIIICGIMSATDKLCIIIYYFNVTKTLRTLSDQLAPICYISFDLINMLICFLTTTTHTTRHQDLTAPGKHFKSCGVNLLVIPTKLKHSALHDKYNSKSVQLYFPSEAPIKGLIYFSPAPHLGDVSQYVGLLTTREDVLARLKIGLGTLNTTNLACTKAARPKPGLKGNRTQSRKVLPSPEIPELIFKQNQQHSVSPLSTSKKLNSTHFYLSESPMQKLSTLWRLWRIPFASSPIHRLMLCAILINLWPLLTLRNPFWSKKIKIYFTLYKPQDHIKLREF